jgi:DnaK suppressor protein
MSPQMVAYFEQKLRKILEMLIKEEELIGLYKEGSSDKEADYVESSQMEELSLEENLPLQNEDRLKRAVEDALYRVRMGTYGYCEETGDPIGVYRLLAFPMARYTTEVQRKKDGLSF